MMGKNGAAIRIDNAYVSYREDVALRGVSLSVHEGEFVSVIGPNGAGKTTILTVVNGLGKLVSGKVWVLGQQMTRANSISVRKKVGYVAQLQNIDPRMPVSVRDAVLMGRYGLLGLLRRPGRRDQKVVDEMLELVSMQHLATRPIGHLSGGEQQRIAIARCLAQEPQILLLDEPTASLDLRARTEVLQLVRLVHNSRSLTILYVTHDLGSLPAFSDRVVLMKEGRIWSEGAPEAMLTDANFSQLYDMPLPEVREKRQRSISVQS